MLGAARALEIPFVFGGLSLGSANRFVFDESKREGYENLSRRMMSYWAEFAYADDPGFRNWQERCAIYGNFVQWSERMDLQENETVGNGACKPHPLDAGLLASKLSNDMACLSSHLLTRRVSTKAPGADGVCSCASRCGRSSAWRGARP